MANEEKRKFPFVKWILYGLLVGICVVIGIFNADIFGANSYIKTFDSNNEFFKYVMNHGISNLCQSILIIASAVTLGIILSLLSKIRLHSKKPPH